MKSHAKISKVANRILKLWIECLKLRPKNAVNNREQKQSKTNLKRCLNVKEHGKSGTRKTKGPLIIEIPFEITNDFENDAIFIVR